MKEQMSKNRRTLQKEIEQELTNLNKEQVIYFSWLCAVRALPYLGYNGDFYFWKKGDRQRYLNNIFFALDYNAYAKIHDANEKITLIAKPNKNPTDYTDFNQNYSYAKAFETANAATIAANNAFDAATKNHAFAAKAIASAAYVVFNYISNSSEDAVKAAAYTAFAAMKTSEKLKGIIIQDLNNIQSKENIKNTDWDVSIWSNFQKALEMEGYGYWAQWYQKIFEQGMILDKEDEKEIKLRLNIAAEIRGQGAAALDRYLGKLKLGSERLNEARILILGDKGAGKTCLARRLKDPNAEMTKEEESTPGVDTSLWKLEKENVNVHIWDFAGHTVTHAVHRFFLSERCLYIIVCNGRTDESSRLEFWLNHMKNYGQNSKAIILVNKCDDHAIEVPINRLKEQYPIIDISTFSIRDDKAELENFRQEVANYISNNPSWSQLLIPENSYKVKNELEKLFINEGTEERKERIERIDFDAIAHRYGVEDGDALLSDLHALGISLWYKDMAQFNTLVLNPEWISNGVYRIINWANNEKKHCLRIEDFDQVFSAEAHRYPQSEHRFLFELMKKYELAYEAKEKDVLIIPRLLEEDQPASLPQFQIGESLMARYKADQPLMPDTISRFIVRHNQEIKIEGDNYRVWRHGVILDDGKGSIALVREEDDRTITVSVKGTNKTEYLSTLRETLNGIFEGYKSKKPELQYRVERFGEISGEIEKQDPLWLADQAIYAHAQQGIPFFDPKTGRQLTLNPMIQYYNIQGNALFGENIHWDQSTHNTTINIQKFQGNIELLKEAFDDEKKLLLKAIDKDEYEVVYKQIERAENAIQEIDSSNSEGKPISAKTNSRLAQFINNLTDEKTTLGKCVKLLENGVDFASKLVSLYGQLPLG